MRQLVLSLLLPGLLQAQVTPPKLDPARVAEIAGWIERTPTRHFTPPFSDRTFWDSVRDRPASQALIEQAAKLAPQPNPELTEDAYNEYTRTGQRWKYERSFGARTERLRAFVLTRTFIYDRADGGRLEIIDQVAFDKPRNFGTAIVLRPWQKLQPVGPSRFRVQADGKAVDVSYSAEGDLPLRITEKPITGIVPSQGSRGTRIGIDLAEPARNATFRLTISPATEPIPPSKPVPQ